MDVERGVVVVMVVIKVDGCRERGSGGDGGYKGRMM